MRLPSFSHTTLFVATLLFGIVLWGGFLRFFHLGDQSYWIDEGFTLMQTRAIAEHGYPLLDSGFVEKKDVLLPALLAPLTSFFPLENASAYRFFSALFGTLSILAVFFLGKAIRGNTAGLLAALFLALSYGHVAWSRQVRGYELLVFCTILSLLFLVHAHRSGRLRTFFFSGLFATLAALSKSFGIFVFSAIAITLPLRKKILLPGIFAGLLLSAFFIPYGISFVQNATSSAHPNYTLRYFFEYLWGGFGLFLPAMLVGIVTAIAFDARMRQLHAAILCFFALTLVSLGSFLYVYEKRYLLLLTPVLFLYSALFLARLVEGFHFRKTLLALLTLVFLGADFFFFHTLQFFPQKFFLLESFTPQPDFRSAYAFLKQKMLPEDTLVSSYPFLDRIYLERVGYAIPLSYTGRTDESSVRNGKEYASGAPGIDSTGNLRAAERIVHLQTTGSVFFLVDTLSERRLPETIHTLLAQKAFLVYEDSFLGISDQTVKIYLLPRQ